MNREIKFRAWYPELKDSETGATLPAFMSYDLVYAQYEAVRTETQQQPMTIGYDHIRTGRIDLNKLLRESKYLMQYTGLKDRNGKEIYEGDVLKWTHPDFKELKKEYKILEMSDIRKSLMIEPDCRNGWIEILGNIYENPELLSTLRDERDESR